MKWRTVNNRKLRKSRHKKAHNRFTKWVKQAVARQRRLVLSTYPPIHPYPRCNDCEDDMFFADDYIV